MKRGHVPVRTCIGCMKQRPKGELVRLAVCEGGLVAGSLAGRGHYLCPSAACLEKALRGKNVRRLLGRDLTERESAQLRRAVLGENDLDGGCIRGVICSESTGGGLIA